MKILIVGGGIAGLALAAHLQKAGITPKIIERAPAWKHIGYVLGIWGKGLDTLSTLTSKENIRSIGYESTVFNIRNKAGKNIKHLSFNHLVKRFGPVILTQRATFHELLQSLVKDVPVKFNTTVTQIDQNTNGVDVTFSDGSKENFDIVVGADGIHSAVRKLVFKKAEHYSGSSGWIYMAQDKFDFPKNATEIWAGNKFFGAYPDKESRLCTIFAKKMPKDEYPGLNHSDYLKKEFADFKWIIPDVLSSMTKTSEIFFDNWDEVVLDKWVNDRVVLIGDAAHASAPAVGMGACMAMEDALVLSNELANTENIKDGLTKFESKRKKHVRMVQNQSYLIQKFMSTDSQPFEFFRDIFLRYIPSSIIVRDFEYMLVG